MGAAMGALMRWDFQLDDRGVVQLESKFQMDDGASYDWREEVKAGGNFCGVKYAEMHAAKSGVLEISWERFSQWKAR